MKHLKIKAVIAATTLCGALLLQAGPASADPTEQMLANPCAGCHGINGASMGDAPILAGLNKGYLVSSMKAYRDEHRYSTIMTRIAKGYTDAQIDAMSSHFAAQQWPANKQDTDAAIAAKGQTLHMSSGCIGCHGPTGTPMMPNVPKISGQYAGFLKQQMIDYKDPNKVMPASAVVMRGMLAGLSEDDIAALAAFYASQN